MLFSLFKRMVIVPKKPYQYSVYDVANIFISLAKVDKNDTLDLLKLQKLCFIAYGRYLAKTKKRLFKEPIEAWKFGPVIPKLYFAFSENNMENPNKKYFINLNTLDAYLFVVDTWQIYNSYETVELIDLTIKEGTPWKKAYTGKFENIIPDALIREYYINHFYKGEE